ncbi:hypothetical protein [Kibdelosporangium philippinense]
MTLRWLAVGVIGDDARDHGPRAKVPAPAAIAESDATSVAQSAPRHGLG